MSKYLGDFKRGDTFDFKFSTVSIAQVPSTLSGVPVVKCYKNNDTATEVTTGLTLTVDHDSVTGLNNVRAVLTDSFYAPQAEYSVIITTGTVGGISVVGIVVGMFSIENRYVPGLLERSTIATLASQTSFTLTAGSADNDAYNGAIAIISDASSTVQKAIAEVSDYVGATKTITLYADPAVYTMAVGDYITILANISGSGLATAAELAKVPKSDAAVTWNSTALASINAEVDTALTSLNDIAASDILGTALTESYGEKLATRTLTQLLYEIKSMLTNHAISGTTWTTKKLDGTTTAKTYTIDNADDPTSCVEAS